jgi:hypothetical protein
VFLGLGGLNYDFATYGRAIPVALFTLVHLAGFAGSLALCWWLICRKGQSLKLWAERLLVRRLNWALTFAGLCLISLSSLFVSFAINPLLRRSMAVTRLNEIYMSQSYALMITILVQTATLIALTLVLTRKRLRANTA